MHLLVAVVSLLEGKLSWVGNLQDFGVKLLVAKSFTQILVIETLDFLQKFIKSRE